MESSSEILDKIHKAAALVRKSNNVEAFKKNFPKIKTLISAIPGHEELVIVNDLKTIESWQVVELQNSLLEQLNKTKLTMQALLKTGYEN